MTEQGTCVRMLEMALLFVSLVVFFTFSISCGTENHDIHARGNPMPLKAIDDVLKAHSKTIMSIPGVVGTGYGLYEDKPCIKVFVIKKSAALDQGLPDSLEGYPVVIEEIGEVKALPRN
jgi:hypothetical protein